MTAVSLFSGTLNETYFKMQVTLTKVDYPREKPSLKTQGGIELIFCPLRKRWLVLTPEEWVRQNFILFLVHQRKFPVSLIAAERKIRVGELDKRFDLLIFDRKGNPFIIIECKEMGVDLSESVLRQVLTYNMKLQAPYLLVTNGTLCAVFSNTSEGFVSCNEVPRLA